MEIKSSSVLPWGPLHNDYLLVKNGTDPPFPSVSHYIYCSILQQDNSKEYFLDTNTMKKSVLQRFNLLKNSAAKKLKDYNDYLFLLTIEEQNYFNGLYFFLRKDLKSIFNIIKSFRNNSKSLKLFYEEIEGKYLDDIVHKACRDGIKTKLLTQVDTYILKVLPDNYSIVDTGFLHQFTNKWTNHYYKIYKKNISISPTLIQTSSLLNIPYTREENKQWIRDFRLPIILKTLDVISREFMLVPKKTFKIIELMFNKCSVYQNSLKTKYVIDSAPFEFIEMYSTIINANCFNLLLLNEEIIYAVWKHISFLLMTLYTYSKHINGSYNTTFKLLSSEFINVFTLEDIVNIIYNITDNVLSVYHFIYNENPLNTIGIVKVIVSLLDVDKKIKKTNTEFITQMEKIVEYLFENQSCFNKQILSRLYYFS